MTNGLFVVEGGQVTHHCSTSTPAKDVLQPDLRR